MKLSKYNFIKNFDGVNVFFNAMTCALAVVDDNFLAVCDDIKNGKYAEKNYNSDLIANMKVSGCIVEDTVDELKLLEFYKLSGKYDASSLSLTIAPTMDCNFRCKYCFESHKKGIMSEATQDAIVKFIKQKISSAKEVGITWYGGEPLIAKKAVYSMSDKIIQLCDDARISFSAFIITNASLITDDDIDNFKRYRISGAQITIDGVKEVHDSRRINVTGESTYEKLINNVNKLLNNDIEVIVRVNIDKNNINGIEDLLAELRNSIDKYDKLKIDFGKVAAFTEVCKSIESECFTTEQYADILLPLYSKVMALGFKLNKMVIYPSIKYNYCCADYVNSFVVDTEGNIYKCWNDVGVPKNACGNVNDAEIKLTRTYLDWIEWNPLNNIKCQKCNMLPICGGGCPSLAKQSKELTPVCDAVKYNLNSVLRYYYEQLKGEIA